jgi:hypothetical protein
MTYKRWHWTEFESFFVFQEMKVLDRRRISVSRNTTSLLKKLQWPVLSRLYDIVRRQRRDELCFVNVLSVTCQRKFV